PPTVEMRAIMGGSCSGMPCNLDAKAEIARAPRRLDSVQLVRTVLALVCVSKHSLVQGRAEENNVTIGTCAFADSFVFACNIRRKTGRGSSGPCRRQCAATL